MIFHVPDLQRYQESPRLAVRLRALPPPVRWVDTTEEVGRRGSSTSTTSAAEYAEAYRRFHDDYLDLDDGHAGERLVDAVFVPRGDA